MARPIAETPILSGKDAERFIEEMKRVDSLTPDQRAENRKSLDQTVSEAKKYINIRI